MGEQGNCFQRLLIFTLSSYITWCVGQPGEIWSLNWFLKLKISKFKLKPLIFNRSSILQNLLKHDASQLLLGRKVLLAFKLKKLLFQSVLYGKMSDPPLIDSSDCYATWSGPVPLSNEDRGAATASKGKTVGFEKQNSVDQDMVRIGEQCICIDGPQASGLNDRIVA